MAASASTFALFTGLCLGKCMDDAGCWRNNSICSVYCAARLRHDYALCYPGLQKGKQNQAYTIKG